MNVNSNDLESMVFAFKWFLNHRRTILLCMAVSARFGVWILEQPASSVLEYYPAFIHMMEGHYKLFGNSGVKTLVVQMFIFRILSSIYMIDMNNIISTTLT